MPATKETGRRLAISLFEWPNFKKSIPVVQLLQSGKQLSLKISAISNWLPLVVNFLVGILLTPVLIRELGKTPYGIWVLAGSLVGYYGLLRLGVGAAIMRYLPFHDSRGNVKKTNEVVNTALVFYVLVALVILLISSTLNTLLADFYQGGGEMAGLVRVVGLAAALECLFLPFDAIIRARGHWIWANGIVTVAAVFRACGLLFCVLNGYGLIAMGWVLVGVNLNSLFLFYLLVHRFFPDIELRLRYMSIRQLYSLLTYGFSSLLIAISLTLTLQGHNFIIGKVLSLNEVSVYAVIVILIRNAREAVVGPNRVIFPRFAFLDGQENHDEIRLLFFKASTVNSLSAGWVYLCVVILGPSFITLWVGDGFEHAYSALVILGIGFLVDSMLAAVPSFMGGIGQQKTMARFAVFEGVTGLVLSYLLTVSYGMTGTAIGLLCTICLVRGVFCLMHICKRLKISYLHFCKEKLLFPVVVLSVIYPLNIWGGITGDIVSWFDLIVAFFLLTSLYFILMHVFVAGRQQKIISSSVLLFTEPRLYLKNLINGH